MQPSFSFEYGRVDCETAPNYPSDKLVGFPPGFLDPAGVLEFFSREFSLDEVESVAILGAHTIGAMGPGSGYTGQWKTTVRTVESHLTEFA